MARSVSVVVMFLALGLPVSFAASAEKKPNVLFIAIDDLNDWVGCLQGHPQAQTPNMDRLAKRGTLFTSAYCPAPLCNPSRAAIMSGVRPHESGIYTNDQPWQEPLRGKITIPEHFGANGYHTLGGGKIFHGRYGGESRFDEYFLRKEDPRPKNEDLRRPHGNLVWGPYDEGPEAGGDYKLVSWAIEELSKPQEKPLFLAVGFVRPHLPWFAPRSFYEKHSLSTIQLPLIDDDDLSDIPPIGRRWAIGNGDNAAIVKSGLHEEAVQAYLATGTYVDSQIGRLIDALDKSPIADNTIIVLWSDHGWHLGEKQHWKKFALWEDTTRVPFIIVAPNVTTAGAVCDRPVDLMSIYPTLIELCGLPTPSNVDESSIVPLLKDADAEWNAPALTTYERGNHAIRHGKWRYIRYNDGTEELYDRETDPNEWNNRTDESTLASVKSELSSFLPTKNAPDVPNTRGNRKKSRSNDD